MRQLRAVLMNTPNTVYDCIVEVAAELGTKGLSKARKNEQQGYKFRGIDDVLNALSPLLAKHRLVILPRVLERTVVERATKNGGVLFFVTVQVAFDFVSAADKSTHTVVTYGEAMDTADKATNKAMSAAYKYATIQAFCIPTEGDNDADAVTHEPVARPAAVVAPAPALVATVVEGTGNHPPGYVAWFGTLRQLVKRFVPRHRRIVSTIGGVAGLGQSLPCAGRVSRPFPSAEVSAVTRGTIRSLRDSLNSKREGASGLWSRWASLSVLGPVLGFFGACQLPSPKHVGDAVAAVDGLTMRTSNVPPVEYGAGVTALNDERLPALLTCLKPRHLPATVTLSEGICSGA